MGSLALSRIPVIMGSSSEITSIHSNANCISLVLSIDTDKAKSTTDYASAVAIVSMDQARAVYMYPYRLAVLKPGRF